MTTARDNRIEDTHDAYLLALHDGILETVERIERGAWRPEPGRYVPIRERELAMCDEQEAREEAAAD